MRSACVIAAAGLLLAGCGGGAARSTGGTPRSTAGAGSPGASRSAPEPPAADAPLPHTPGGIAKALAGSTRDLETAIGSWLRTKPAVSARPPQGVALHALYQQRIYRYLRRHPALAQDVIAAMPLRLRPQARDNFGAGRSLFTLAPKKPPKTQPRIRIGQAEPPGRLLRWYREAQRRFGVRWQILAAVNFVESGFNRLRNNSYAGAQGPMQFIPATWRAYGLGGDVRDPHDAIMGAANYLHASGAAASERNALYHYNPSPLYVDAIMRYARQMQRRTQRYYAYWSWQVFYRDKRLTGPGI